MQRLQKLKSRKPHLGAPLPFIYIAPYLQRAGFEVEFLDLRISDVKHLRHCLEKTRPVVAGISVMPGSALPRILHLSHLIKKWSPKTSVVWGGAFPSLHQQFCLGLPGVDYVVVGDGEETLPELTRCLSNGGPPSALAAVAGLAFRNNGSTVATEPREPVDLDANPIGAWKMVDRYMPYYLGPSRYIAINTARGCPYRCTFCYNNLLYHGHKRYRLKGVDAVMTEIDYLVERHQIRKVQFMDDEFLGHRRRGFELIEQLNEHHPQLKYHIAARVQDLKEEHVVRRLAETGCDSVFIGAESASPELLEKMQKGMTTTELIDAARNCRRVGIKTTYSFACGFPGETKSDLKATVAMAGLLREVDTGCQCILEIISPVAGTPMFAELQRDEQVPDADLARWCHFTDWKSARSKNWISRPGYYEAFQLAFYLAFATAGHAAGLRSPVRWLSRWSSRRLAGQRLRLLPEYRAANFLIKKSLWGWHLAPRTQKPRTVVVKLDKRIRSTTKPRLPS
jgi:radical SAM superfamily enzyme YgiQ (UPF0313 family)